MHEQDQIEVLDLRESFFKVSNDIFEYELNPYEISVYFLLCRYANNNTTQSYPSISKIVDKTKMSRPTVVSSIKSLVAKKIIHKVSGNVSTSNRYYLNNLPQKNTALVKEVNYPSKRGELPLVKEVNSIKTNVIKTKEKDYINPNCPEIPDSSKKESANNAQTTSQSAKVDNPFTLTNLAIKRGYITKDYFDILLAFIKESTMDINYNNLKGICAKLTEVSNSLGKMYRDDFNNGSRGYTTFALYHYLRYRKWYLTLDIFKYFPEWVKTWDKDVRTGYANNGSYYTYKLDDMSSKEKIETVKWSEWNNLMLEKQRSK